jgi:dTDP-4-dehydrorhamnose reductase
LKRILVIGASGLLGSKFYEIAKENYEIYGTYFGHEIKGENFFKLNACDRKEVFKLVEKIKPSAIFDFHSITDVDYCELHPEEAWEVNVNGTKNIAEACKTFGVKMVFISSDYIFDGKKSSYSEKDKPNPLNYYGKTKAIAEKVIEFLVPDFIIARTAVLYGLGGYGKKPFPLWVLDNLKEGKEIRVVIDQFNNPTFADDLARILLKLYEKDAFGIFHAVGKDNVSRYEFALKVAEIFNLDKNLIKQITSPELRQAAFRPRKLELSTKKLQRVLGIIPIGIDEGLKILKQQMEGKS